MKIQESQMSQAVLGEPERFSTNLLDLCDLMHILVTNCYDNGYKDINPGLILLAKAYLSNQDKVELIETFISNSHMYWNEIHDKNENFFIEHTNEVFGKLPVDSNIIGVFRTFFTAKDKKGEFVVSEQDREYIWETFFSLVKISIKHVHKIRECVLVQNPETGRMRPSYKHNRYPEIKVMEYAKLYGLSLDIPR